MKDLIEELAHIAREAKQAGVTRTDGEPFEAWALKVEALGVSAILSALASKGVDALPNIEEVRTWFAERGGTYSTETREGASMMRAAAAPILAAKDAERDALRARVAELEAAILETPQGCKCEPSSGCRRAILREVAGRGRVDEEQG